MQSKVRLIHLVRNIGGAAWGGAALVLVLAWSAPVTAKAESGRVITLKQVQATDESQVDLLFDGKITSGQIQVDYFNDIVQLSLKDVSVYPAKISSVNSPSLSKIFAYQYAPKLVRCRFSVKGRAEALKDKLKIEADGKVLSVRFPSTMPAAETREQAVPQAAPTASAPKAQSAAAQAQSMSSENEPIERPSKGKASQPIAGGKPLPSPFAALGKLALVLAIFGGGALAVNKVRNKNGKLMSALGKFANGTLARKGKMIEVVSTHHLGPKKSIAVVKVAGRLLVLGVSNDSINLITQLAEGKSDADLEDLLMSDDVKHEAAFSALLGAEQAKPAAPQPLPPAPRATAPVAAGSAPKVASPAVATAAQQAANMRANGARERIKSRLEGLKQL